MRDRLTARARAALGSLTVFERIDSTSTRLLAAAADGAPSGSVYLSDHQYAGRGRRGRTWTLPPGAGLALSLLWRLEATTAPGGLSLAAGVAVADALAGLGAAVGLKWPNDVLYDGRKLAGILLEAGGERGAPFVVVGVGVNLALPADARAAIGQPVADLGRALGAPPPSAAVAAALLNRLLPALADFADAGPADVIERWRGYDLTRDRALTLRLPDETVVGVGRGVAADGALCVDTAHGPRRFYAGDVSLRLAS